MWHRNPELPLDLLGELIVTERHLTPLHLSQAIGEDISPPIPGFQGDRDAKPHQAGKRAFVEHQSQLSLLSAWRETSFRTKVVVITVCGRFSLGL